jgi:hypothetical protein
VTSTYFRMAAVIACIPSCRPLISANAACNLDPSSSAGSKRSTIGVERPAKRSIDERRGAKVAADQHDHRVDVPGDESPDTLAEAQIPLRTCFGLSD